jgi:protein-arginine kinase activator protein McsA
MLHDLSKFNIIKDITSGYELVYYPNHPNAKKGSGTVYLHRLIMENYLDRYLDSSEIVHHEDENKSRNVIENLKLTNNSEHNSLHDTYLDMKICEVCGVEYAPDKDKRKYCSQKCFQASTLKIEWPSVEYIKKQLKTKSMVQVGKELGVSDNAVRKYLKRNK